VGTDLAQHTPTIKSVMCPFTNEVLTAVPAINPDVTVIHAQRADRRGNVQIWGLVGIQKEAVLAAQHSIVTVEELVEELTPIPGAVVLPSWVVSAVCLVPGGAHPSFAMGYSERDNAFYQQWDEISRERATFEQWVDRHIRSTEDFAAYRSSVGLDPGGVRV
jgi:glutaconate CoA-transferase subunit A